MGAATSIARISGRMGKMIEYVSAESKVKVEFKALVRDYGEGGTPNDVDSRFKRVKARWFKLTVLQVSLPEGAEPRSGDLISVLGYEATVRQTVPLGPDRDVWQLFADSVRSRS